MRRSIIAWVLLVGSNGWACSSSGSTGSGGAGQGGNGSGGNAGSGASAGSGAAAGAASGGSSSGGAAGQSASAGAGGSAACNPACHATLDSTNCNPGQVLWGCGPQGEFADGWEVQCTALLTPQPTYCCAATFLSNCY
jgi:hypothetical protein